MHPSYRSSESWVWIVVVVLVVVVLVPGVLFMGGSTGMMGGGTPTWGGWLLGVGLLVVAVVVGLVVIAVLMSARLFPREAAPMPYSPPYPGYPPSPAAMTPIQVLDARYARGEITREEYLRMRQDLEQPRP